MREGRSKFPALAVDQEDFTFRGKAWSLSLASDCWVVKDIEAGDVPLLTAQSAQSVPCRL